jgi:hypothetical protein
VYALSPQLSDPTALYSLPGGCSAPTHFGASLFLELLRGSPSQSTFHRTVDNDFFNAKRICKKCEVNRCQVNAELSGHERSNSEGFTQTQPMVPQQSRSQAHIQQPYGLDCGNTSPTIRGCRPRLRTSK